MVKKRVLSSVMLAMVLGVTVPAFGLDDTVTTRQGNTVVPSLTPEQDVESGDVVTGNDISISGDSNGVCVPTQQAGSTGNDLNLYGLQPTQADLIDPELTGFETEDGNLEQTMECVPTITQESTATG